MLQTQWEPCLFRLHGRAAGGKREGGSYERDIRFCFMFVGFKILIYSFFLVFVVLLLVTFCSSHSGDR